MRRRRRRRLFVFNDTLVGPRAPAVGGPEFTTHVTAMYTTGST